MSVLTFWASIDEGARARVTSPDEPGSREITELEILLKNKELATRKELAFNPPELDMLAAKWAAIQLYRAAQFLLFRDLSSATIKDALSKPCVSDVKLPATVYSVDLCFCYLPGVVRQATAISADDPLTHAVRKWAQEWPLSSVGIPRVEEISAASLDPIFIQPSLRTLYADRIIERKDKSRLNDPRVQEAVREALGAHRSWHPEMSSVFVQEDAVKSSQS